MTLNKIKRLRAKIDGQREKGGIKPAVLENLASVRPLFINRHYECPIQK